jgi:hypothetical protein
MGLGGLKRVWHKADEDGLPVAQTRIVTIFMHTQGWKLDRSALASRLRGFEQK